MTAKDHDPEATRLDDRMHRPRLKSGLVDRDTRIYLRVTQGPESGRVFDLSPGGAYLVGRRSGDVPLSDPKVSLRHAEIRLLGPDAHFLVDLASTNGTFLNGRRVDRDRFGSGDEIRIGDTILLVGIYEKTVAVAGE